MKKLDLQSFIARAKQIHGDRYSYSNVVYEGNEKKVAITCLKHGDFLITPHSFLAGHGCPICSNRERINTSVFVKRAAAIHKGRYDYSLSSLSKRDDIVEIICPIHGRFLQKADYHLNGNGCPLCFGTPKSTTNDFIKKARRIYGSTYDYSKVDYKGNKEKVCIICPKHGEWWVTPNNFLRGSRCPKCYGTPKTTIAKFVEKARSVHGDRYDYSKVSLKDNKTKVCIVCPIHGEFWQTPSSHYKGSGCPLCNGKQRLTRETFIKQAINIHGIRYDYSKVAYKNNGTKVCIVCPIHGEFWQIPQRHLAGANCPKCAGGVKLDQETFVQKARKVHGTKYDYSKVIYKNYSTKVCIVCPIHGEFWQTPNNHLFGTGCPVCPQSNLEGTVREFLTKNYISFEQEKSFDWLRYKKRLFLDFYLPDYKVAIECQGLQHFSSVEMFGGAEFFNKTVERDKHKRELCQEHGIKVLYFSNAHVDFPYETISTFSKLLEEIKNSSGR